MNHYKIVIDETCAPLYRVCKKVALVFWKKLPKLYNTVSEAIDDIHKNDKSQIDFIYRDNRTITC